jgi:class 3 adenylate cyclase
MDPTVSRVSFHSVKRTIVVIDLAGYTKAFQSAGDEKMVDFVQDYYEACEKAITAQGGKIIKFIGDACLAVFAADQAKNAVDAVVELQSTIDTLGKNHNMEISLGANLHLSSTIEGEFGIGSSKRSDVLGRGVNQTFLLGRGSGLRISEAVYRALPSSARAPWNKHKPPAVYHFSKTR